MKGRKAATVRVPKINLLPEDPFYDTLVGKVLRWAVSVGRYIIMLTELIVIGSFLTRFTLDRQLNDLNALILQKQAIVESYGDLEQRVRAIQKQAKDIAGFRQQQGNADILQMLMRLTPTGVSYEQVSFLDGRVNLKGVSLSSQSLANLLAGLQAERSVTEMTISEIQSGDRKDPGVNFSLSFTFVP